MKNYDVDVDITMSRRYHVEAENDEEARRKVNEIIHNNPYDYCDSDYYVNHEIIEVNIEV